MKPAPFVYHAPDTLEEALSLLAEHGDDARPLAGGQSLVPMLSLRLARPAHLIDLNAIDELKHVDTTNGTLVVGAMVRQRAGERSDVVRQRCPLLAEAISLIGHPPIRNRGTVGGSIAHADPAAELPAVAVALDAELVARRTSGERTIPAGQFFVGHYTTAIEPDECLTEIHWPTTAPGSGWAFEETARRHGDFAMAGVAATTVLDDAGRISQARLALTGVSSQPVRAREAEAVLAGATADRSLFEAAGQAAATAIDPPSDLHASAAYRRHVVAVLVRRALERAVQRAGGAQ
jgi:carbon-monoxide dehydrogenase medium subunit